MLRYLISLLLLFNLVALIQAQDFPVREFTIQNGLIHNHVTSLFQDSKNYLWVGTQAGISRFNGEDFMNYNTKNGLTFNHFIDMTEDKSGDIWAISPEGLACFDGITWHSLKIKNPYLFSQHAKIGINDFGSPYISDQGILFEILDNNLVPASRFSKLNFRDSTIQFYYHADQNLWIIKKQYEVMGYRAAGLKELFKHEFQAGNEIELLSCAGQLIIKDANHIIEKYYTLTGLNLELLAEMHSGHEPVVLKPFPHKYCIVSKNSIFRYYPLRNKFVKMRAGEKDWQQKKIIVSGNQNLFFTEGEGFSQILCESFTSYTSVKNTWMLALGSGDTVFAGGYFPSSLYKIKGADVEEIDLKEMYQQINSVTPTPRDHYSFYQGGAFLKDNTGYFPFSAGVVEYKAGKVRAIVDNPFESVFFAHADTLRNRVVCGIGGGIMIIENGNISEKFDASDGLHINVYITSIAQDSKQRYWLGSTDGLTCFDPDSKKGIRSFTSKNYSHILRGGVISMTCDQSGRLWIGTAKGLCYLDDDLDDIVLVSKDQMLNYCSSIVGTKDQHLLIGSPEGIVKFDSGFFIRTGKIRYKTYNQASGYLKEDTVTAILKDSSGAVWMGCLDHLVKFNPHTDTFTVRNLHPSILSINGVRISRNPGSIKPFVVYDNQLSIVYEAVGFSRPSVTEYTYRLKGMDDQWRPWTAFQYAIFENLRNGKYEFQVKAKSQNAGHEDLPISSVPVIISASFVDWPTFPYYIALIFILILLGIMILIFKYNQTANRQIQLEKEAKFLRVQALQSQMNPHFVFNVLASVQNLVVKNDTKLAAKYLADFGTMIRQFLNASVTGNSYNDFDKNQTIPLKDEISLINTFVHLEQFNYPGRFEYIVEVAEDFRMENYTIPPMIVQPFVENAIKYGLLFSGSRDRLLTLRIRGLTNHGFEITIEDNGVGRAKAREFQQKSNQIHKSLGSDLVLERIRILNQMGNKIQLDISDHPLGGTLVRITILELQ